MESKVYNQKGAEVSNVMLPENVFGVKWNADLVHQVTSSMETSKRRPVAHTKNRGEVRGGGKKPWQQKGLGRARHGSIRSPIWVGGGVTHGPRNEKNFDRKVNKKMKTKALFTILSKKFKDGEVLFLDSISFSKPNTKEAKVLLVSLSGIKGFERLVTKKTNSVFLASPSKEKNVLKSFSNFKNTTVAETRNISPLDLLQYKYVIFVNPKESIKILETRLSR